MATFNITLEEPKTISSTSYVNVLTLPFVSTTDGEMAGVPPMEFFVPNVALVTVSLNFPGHADLKYKIIVDSQNCSITKIENEDGSLTLMAAGGAPEGDHTAKLHMARKSGQPNVTIDPSLGHVCAMQVECE